eukprot:TRINITY_DN7054_c0_g1_i1.p1 TRINITY_DN7054_c0_g1~~TRINITY_DN7054_c0_g1_i1.p1  ORF type:complete len:265 (-),score=82.90 TRINITY_DN7054_c0_g1_i1:56-850(-)
MPPLSAGKAAQVGNASFGYGLPEAGPAKKAKEWSPIDRMLANKRGSKSASPKPSSLTPMSSTTPTSIHSHSPEPVSMRSSEAQTHSWNTILTEVVAPDRQRITALQGEIKALRARLKDKELGEDAEAQAKQREEAQAKRIADLEAEMDALRQERDRQVADMQKERDGALEECKELKSKLNEASEFSKRGREDLDLMRADLAKSKEMAKGLQAQLTTMSAESAALAEERDQLLQKLEDQQEEMNARVDAIEKRLAEKAAADAARR